MQPLKANEHGKKTGQIFAYHTKGAQRERLGAGYGEGKEGLLGVDCRKTLPIVRTNPGFLSSLRV